MDSSRIEKNVVITGGSRGVGRSLVMAFLKRGCKVATCYKNDSEDAKELISLANDNKDRLLVLKKDVSLPSDVISFWSEIKRFMGDVDLLINNAAISYIGPMDLMNTQEWRNIIDTNLGGVFYNSKEAYKIMVPNKKGLIVNISSVWGQIGASCEVAYSASKGGVDTFTKALAKELAPSNVRVNSLSLGVLDTDMNSNLSRRELEELISDIPLGRLCEFEDVYNIIEMLLYKDTYMTGQIITISGGWNL